MRYSAMPKPDFQRVRVDAQWTEERAARALTAIERRTKRRTVMQASLAAAAALALGVGVARWITASPKVAIVPSPSASAVEPKVATATALSPDAAFAAQPDGKGYVLSKGRARFVVPHDPSRTFRVTAGPVTVEDLGTIFTVERAADDAVVVTVEEGRVKVVDPSGSVEVGGGETRRWVPVVPTIVDASAPVPSTAPSASTVRRPAPWVPLAESGKYGEAYDALSKSGSSSVRDDTAELLLAADTARLSGHPAAAVPYLEQVLRLHDGDPRAGLAAFTLGRVQLDELGDPSAAATAFARARRGGGALAEDALAREVEARSRAGDKAQARTLALEYDKQYPNGRRHASVMKFGGLD